MALARNIQGSNSIEGFQATLDDAAAVAVGEEPLDVSAKTRLALEGYRNAMTYVLQLSQEPAVTVSLDLIKSLHFMMTNDDLSTRPGRWRSGSIFVQREATGEIVYEGADLDQVPELMSMLVEGMNEAAGLAVIRAAMVHLNLVMIHPFRDGNGRMARCLQSQVGGGRWQPHRDARPWIRFVLTAHLRQAQTLLRRVRASEMVWVSLEALIKWHRLPERSAAALFDATSGYRLRRGTYAAALAGNGDEVSEQTATRDLKVLVDAGLLQAQGDKRGRVYTAGPPLLEIRDMARAERQPKDLRDPFAGTS